MPFLVQALERPGISGRGATRCWHDNMGRLDRSAVPALLAVLDSPDARLAADAATALGRIGDPRAVPFLTYPAAAADAPPAVRAGGPGGDRPADGPAVRVAAARPAQVLTDAAWGFHRHQVEFPGDPVVVWTWDKTGRRPRRAGRAGARPRSTSG